MTDHDHHHNHDHHRDHDTPLPHAHRRARAVVVLSAATMLVELVAGWLTGSMALIADGWHMATHVGAALLTWLAYSYGQRAERLGRLAFGPAKVNALSGYTSALLLGAAAVVLGAESIQRVVGEAHQVHFAEALPVAVAGLAVNLAAAFLLGHPSDGHHDHNLRGLYLHVLADALTSLLAIGALAAGALAGLGGLDPVAGLIGAVTIVVWAAGLARRTAAELMDMGHQVPPLRSQVVGCLAGTDGVRVEDVRVWPLGGGAFGCTVRVLATAPISAAALKDRIRAIAAFTHLAVEVHHAGSPERHADDDGIRGDQPVHVG